MFICALGDLAKTSLFIIVGSHWGLEEAKEGERAYSCYYSALDLTSSLQICSASVVQPQPKCAKNNPLHNSNNDSNNDNIILSV